MNTPPPPGAPAATAAPTVTRLADYRPPAWRVTSLDLRFDLHEDHTLVTALGRYELAAGRAGGSPPLVLDGVGLELVALRLDGEALGDDDHERDGRTLRLAPVRLAGGTSFELEVVTRLRPQDNASMQGLYRAGGTWCTQMEAQGFRHVTYFLDRPDVLTTWTTTITADRRAAPVLLSNGNLVEQRDLGGGRHLARWHDPIPKPCYLFAMVAGDLDHIEDRFVTSSGRDVALRVYVDRGKAERARHAMASLKRAMAWDERVYGREYDLDVFMIAAVSAFNMGAMENKGLNIFNDALILADPATATDTDYLRIEGVVGHEYFHNWSGDRVTCRDWFQISLKEGFTVLRDQTFSGDCNDPAVQRIQDVRFLREMQFPEDAGPMAHPVRPTEYISIDNFYTRTVYQKGAEVIRMMRAWIGPQAFRAGTDLYFERHDGQAVTTDDFRAALADASGADLDPFVAWYEQAGTPRLAARGAWDAARRAYTLEVSQSCPPTPGQPRKRPFPIPIAMGLVGRDGRALPLRLEGEAAAAGTSRVLRLTGERAVFRFVDVPVEPLPSLLRGFSAPVELDDGLQPADLAFLAEHDEDDFGRWEAARRLATRALLAAAAPDPLLVATWTRLIERAADDVEGAGAALAAEVLMLPTELALAEAAARPDPDAIHAARDATIVAIGRAAREPLAAIYRRLHGREADARHVAAIGRRALKNQALSRLCDAGDAEALRWCREQLARPAHMTDERAALEIVARSTADWRGEALAAFKARWRGEPLVLDKWLQAQAAATRESVVEDVERLARDDAFDARNPNRMRALWRTFAENPLGFHRRDGRGYEILADALIETDGRNPILAARLAMAFNPWRRYDERRAAAARAQIERMTARDGLSDNLYEVLSKALA